MLLSLSFSCKSPQGQMLEKSKSDLANAIKTANDDTPSERTIRFCRLSACWRDDACKEAKIACDAAQKNKSNKKAMTNFNLKKKICQKKQQEYNGRCSKIKQ